MLWGVCDKISLLSKSHPSIIQLEHHAEFDSALQWMSRARSSVVGLVGPAAAAGAGAMSDVRAT